MTADPEPAEPAAAGVVVSLGHAVAEYVSEHARRLEQQELRVRSGDDRGVHRMRVAARRLRSALTTFADVFGPGEAERLRVELRWLGAALAGARDAQVQRERLIDLVEQQPVELVLGPVRERLVEQLGARVGQGRGDAQAALDGDRWERLRGELRAFVDSPPWRASADEPGLRHATGLLRADLDRLRRRQRRAAGAATGRERDAGLHDVRKAAKRLRYAAEAARPVLGPRAEPLRRRAKYLQEVLGEHQDTVVARAVLVETGVRAHLAGENSFTYGVLHAIEDARAAALVLESARLVDELTSRKLRRRLTRSAP